MKQIIIVIGTRAEFIKMIPVFWELKKQNIDFQLISTGQHNLNNLSKKYKIKIDKYITEPPIKSSRFGFSKFKALFWSLTIFWKVRNLIKKETLKLGRSPLIIVQGDTLSVAIISIVTGRLKYPLIHIEAGLFSNSNLEPFPEEICRKVSDYYSTICFAPTKEAYNRLKKKDKEVYYVGNTIIDLVKSYKFKVKSEDYAICTIHRGENLRSELRMRFITTILNNYKFKIILFAHDPLLVALKKYNLKLNKNIQIKKLVNHKEFIKKLTNCSLIFSDGGSITEESWYYNKPLILLRAYNERIERNVKEGASQKIVEILKRKIKEK